MSYQERKVPLENQRKFSSSEQREALERAGHRCQRCRGTGSTDNPLTFHHAHIWQSTAKRFAIPGNFVADSANAVVLCRDCHDIIHDGHQIQTTSEIIRGIERVGIKTGQEEQARELLRPFRAVQ